MESKKSTVRIMVGDCIERLRDLSDESIQG